MHANQTCPSTSRRYSLIAKADLRDITCDCEVPRRLARLGMTVLVRAYREALHPSPALVELEAGDDGIDVPARPGEIDILPEGIR